MAGPGAALAQPCRREQRAAPWHATAIPGGAAGFPEKAPAGYFRVGSDSPLAGCRGLHSTCRGCPPPHHHAAGKALLLSPSLSAPWTPGCSRIAPGSPPKPASAPPRGACTPPLGSRVCPGEPGRGRIGGNRAPCPFPHLLAAQGWVPCRLCSRKRSLGQQVAVGMGSQS